MFGEVIEKIIGITKEFEEDSDTSGLLLLSPQSSYKKRDCMSVMRDVT